MSTPKQPLVLIVDDLPDLVALMARILAPEGYRLITAMSGEEALSVAAAQTEPIDLLLTDLQMPGMTGRVLSRELLKSQPRMKVLYQTGHCDELFGYATLLEDHEAFIEKPLSPPRVREAVALHLFGTICAPAR